LCFRLIFSARPVRALLTLPLLLLPLLLLPRLQPQSPLLLRVWQRSLLLLHALPLHAKPLLRRAQQL
jgi:hypothetical protein